MTAADACVHAQPTCALLCSCNHVAWNLYSRPFGSPCETRELEFEARRARSRSARAFSASLTQTTRYRTRLSCVNVVCNPRALACARPACAAPRAPQLVNTIATPGAGRRRGAARSYSRTMRGRACRHGARFECKAAAGTRRFVRCQCVRRACSVFSTA